MQPHDTVYHSQMLADCMSLQQNVGGISSGFVT